MGNNDWRSLPRKGRLKRDTSIKIRVPEVYRNAWQSAADQENASLSDWIYRKLKPLISVEEADK